MAERKLRQIERQILGADVVKRADNASLHERPEVFDIVRVDVTAHIDLLTMSDDLVRIALGVQLPVGRMYVRG